VFSGEESFGTKFGSMDVRRSGGEFWAPTDGIPLAIVELVLVKCGLSGFSVCIFRCSAEVSGSFAFPAPANRRGIVEKDLLKVIDGRIERKASLVKVMICDMDCKLYLIESVVSFIAVVRGPKM